MRGASVHRNAGDAAARLDEDEKNSIGNTDVNAGRGNPKGVGINDTLFVFIIRQRLPLVVMWLLFGKQHEYVMRDISNLVKNEPSLGLSNFG